MNISLSYCQVDGVEKTLSLEPDEYFDLDYMENSIASLYDLPLHDRISDYVDKPLEVIQATVHIKSETGRFREIRTVYWDKQESECTTIVDGVDGKVQYREIILSQKVDIVPIAGWVITRIEYQNGNLVPLSSSFVKQNKDGTQKDYPSDLRKLEGERGRRP